MATCKCVLVTKDAGVTGNRLFLQQLVSYRRLTDVNYICSEIRLPLVASYKLNEFVAQ